VCSPRVVNGKSFSEVPQMWCSTVCGQKMLSRLPHQGKSLTFFRLFNWTSLHIIGAAAGNATKRSLSMTVMQQKCRACTASDVKRNVCSEVWWKCDWML